MRKYEINEIQFNEMLSNSMKTFHAMTKHSNQWFKSKLSKSDQDDLDIYHQFMKRAFEQAVKEQYAIVSTKESV